MVPPGAQGIAGLPGVAPSLLGGTGASAASGNGEMVVECPQHIVGRVIGRGGETIRDLQEKSGCSIQIKQEGVPDGHPRRII
eukprot:155354-Amphidinium_carterae.1